MSTPKPTGKYPGLAAALGPPPATLFHYTDQSGLLGILRKPRSIWATHTRYLNDQAEFLEAIRLFGELAPTVAAATDAERVHLQTLARKAAKFEHGSNVCVASFSEDGDSLPQWRAYGRPGSAFAIGFRGQDLAELAAREMILLAKCMYHDVEQRALIIDVIQKSLVRAVELQLAGEKMRHTRALALLNEYAPILKHKSFHNEVEWRLITQGKGAADLRFRQGKSTIIPYRCVPLVAVTIEKIVIGPTPHLELAIAAVTSLLKSHGIAAPVVKTEAPFRDW